MCRRLTDQTTCKQCLHSKHSDDEHVHLHSGMELHLHCLTRSACKAVDDLANSTKPGQFLCDTQNTTGTMPVHPEAILQVPMHCSNVPKV